MNGTLTNTFFSTNGEVSYKSNKYVWAYNETQIDLMSVQQSGQVSLF